jgi:hypothetical protein
MKKVIIIKKTGEIKNKSLQNIDRISNVNITHKDILKLFNKQIQKSKKFKKNCKRYCDWELDDSIISLFGCKEGKAGSENKYDLPPPEDNDIYFGEIVVIKSINGTIVDMNVADFEEFIELSFGGFEDLGSKDTEEEYDPALDQYESDFVVDDDEDNIEYEDNYNPHEESEEEEEYKSSTNEEEEEEEEEEELN